MINANQQALLELLKASLFGNDLWDFNEYDKGINQNRNYEANNRYL